MEISVPVSGLDKKEWGMDAVDRLSRVQGPTSVLPLLLCFDVDGTLETSLEKPGPVTLAQLRALEQAGIPVIIVSPSPARPPGFHESLVGSRTENLKAAAARFPTVFRAYVSDNDDYEAAWNAGFSYIDLSRLNFWRGPA